MVGLMLAVSLMSYNIHHGEGMDKRFDLERIAEVIRSENPDYVGLQELDQMTRRVGGVNSCDRLAKACGMHYTFAKTITIKGGEYGVAMLSKQKPISVRQYPLPGQEPRVLLLCEFADCWAGTMHLSLQATNRLASAKIVTTVLDELGDKPVFLSGDWNANPKSPELAELKRKLTVLTPEDQSTLQVDDGRDAAGKRKNLCIDYIAVRRKDAARFTVEKSAVIDERIASDHKPMVVRLAP